MKKYIHVSIILLVIWAGQFNWLKAQDSLDYQIPEEMLKELSPEERKHFQEAMDLAKDMKDKGQTINIPTGDGIQIPPRQDKLLNNIPVLASQQQYNSYMADLLSSCQKNIDPSIISEVDALISANSSSSEALVNLGPFLLLQNKPAAAIYAAIKTAIAKAEIILLQNNLGVILQQTGYPHKSLPILQYLLPANNHALILNNIGQAYLSLGDTSNARINFMACLKKDPDNCEANCGMGLLTGEEGNISEATSYIIKSLKNGYSDAADGLMKKHKMNIKFSDIKEKVPEIFNPQKYKPIPPADAIEMVETTLIKREELHQVMHKWMQLKDKVNTEQNTKMETETLIQIADRTRGYFSNTLFAKKSQLMLNLIGIEYGEFMAKDFKNQYLAIEKGYHDQLDKDMIEMEVNSKEETCKEKIAVVNEYLQKTAKNHRAYQQAALPDIFEWTNQSLYWWYFVSNKELYKLYFTNFVSDFFEAIHGFDDLQPLSTHPDYIAKNCKDEKKPVKDTSAALISPEDPDCPIKIEIPFVVGKAKWDCKSFELEGGEGIVGGLEKDYKTGDITIFGGFGGGIYEKGFGIGGIEAGWKVGSFVKIGKDFSILDCGNKGEIGIEGGIGPFMTEAKLTGVMGMQSGINVTKNIMGEETSIIKPETEIQINPKIPIFK